MSEAKQLGFNTILLGIPWRGNISLHSTPWIKPAKGVWTRKELVSIVDYARRLGLEVVPNIPLLSHQDLLLSSEYPGLMFNSVTYDPRSPKVYDVVLPILDEMIELIHPKAIHIGHDEVIGWEKSHFRKILRPGERMLPADLFLSDVLRLHEFLNKRGVETWMWGDMLISAEEFPTMKVVGLNGVAPGYGKALRDKLPKEIVICDWHYLDDQLEFPSLSVMQKEGFRVIGTTWKKNDTIRHFSRYARQHGAYGMMATTWFHVQRKEWSVVGDILKVSGEAFSQTQ